MWSSCVLISDRLLIAAHRRSRTQKFLSGKSPAHAGHPFSQCHADSVPPFVCVHVRVPLNGMWTPENAPFIRLTLETLSRPFKFRFLYILLALFIHHGTNTLLHVPPPWTGLAGNKWLLTKLFWAAPSLGLSSFCAFKWRYWFLRYLQKQGALYRCLGLICATSSCKI